MVIQKLYLIPVSYTHLDVYKRQIEKCVIVLQRIKMMKNIIFGMNVKTNIIQATLWRLSIVLYVEGN